MIGMLSGRIAYKMADHVVLDVGGVGYQVYCSERTLANIGRAGDVTRLYTELLVREDILQLFGFLKPVEREWYKLLTSVQGVGGKAAMNILGALGADAVGRAITIGDTASVRAAPGVGPKLAARIVNELKDKAITVMAQVPLAVAEPTLIESGSSDTDDIASVVKAAPVSTMPEHQDQSALQAEAMSALINLGYDRSAAAQTVAKILSGTEDISLTDLIKAALKELMPGK